ncbi:MAG: class I SAM-dependent methyltransferase [Cyanosarcina radialis HA8281-LM2]|nr:class I SAM-dependent methyltransferase [Cyanosarcina radialis HA8281-LM2]
MLFDQPFYLSINEARWIVAQTILNEIKLQIDLSSCLDVGCGPGWFSQKLIDLGLSVTGIDGRLELVELARKRVEKAQFYCGDLESKNQISSFSAADLVFCFGLLYHTENPFRAIRNLYALTKKVLLIESIIIPGDNPIAWLVKEGQNETQGLTHYALIPSRTCTIQMLRVAGFKYVYEYNGEVNHEDFKATDTKHQRRRIFLASLVQLGVNNLVEVPEISTPKYNFSNKSTIS